MERTLPYLPVQVGELEVEEATGEAAEAQVRAEARRAGEQRVGVHSGALKVGHPRLLTAECTRVSFFEDKCSEREDELGTVVAEFTDLSLQMSLQSRQGFGLSSWPHDRGQTLDIEACRDHRAVIVTFRNPCTFLKKNRIK